MTLLFSTPFLRRNPLNYIQYICVRTRVPLSPFPAPQPPHLKPFCIREINIKYIMPDPEIDIERVLFSSDHHSLNEAVLADIISAIPVVGEIGDFFRAVEANTERKRVLQIFDLISGPLPTPTNTILFLDKTGKIDLSFIESVIKTATVIKKR